MKLTIEMRIEGGVTPSHALAVIRKARGVAGVTQVQIGIVPSSMFQFQAFLRPR
jgi:hypothetical protein